MKKLFCKRMLLMFLIAFNFLLAQDSSNTKSKKISLQLKWKNQFQSAGFIMAKEKGFYKDVGLDVNILEFDRNIHTMEDLQKGKIEFAISDSALILEAMNHSNVVAMMSILQNSPYSLMALKSSGIKSLQDINNKKLALYDNLDGMSINAMLLSNHIKYIKTPVAFSLDTLINGSNDMQTVYLSNEPFIAKEMGLEVVLFNPKDYGFDSYGDILFTSKKLLKDRPELVEKMYESSKKGWEYAFSNIDETVDIIYKKYNTLNKSKKALSYEAEILKSLSGYGKNFGKINIDKVQSIAQIFSFIQKGKNNFDNLQEFIYKPQSYKKEEKTLLFTQEELDYIKTKKKIKVCSYKEAFPFVIFNEKNVTGSSIEYLKLITKKSNLNFEVIEAKNTKEHFKMIQNGQCDVSAMIVTKPNLFDFLIPTKPMGTDSVVLVTKINQPYIDNLNNLDTQKIAIQKGGKNLIKYVKSLYPKMNLREVDNFDMKNIENGNFYGRIGTSYQMSYIIATEYFNSLKIMSKIGDVKIQGSFGITVREPILLNIFNKALDDISLLEKQKINNAYLSVTVEKQFDYTRFFQIFSVALLIIMTLLFFYIKQRKLKKEIENEKDKFENIFNSASDGITILTNGILTDCNTSVIRLLGYKSKKDILTLTPSQLSPKYQPDGRLSKDKSKEMTQIALKNGYNHFQWVHKKADGSEFWCDIILTNISTNNDEQIFHGVWRDISKQKELEAEILQINSSLEQRVKEEVKKNEQQQLLMLHQNRLAQMGEMISVIAHQWRQPLNNISVMLQTIFLKYQKGKMDATIMEKFKIDILKQIHYMSNTIDDFRDFYKPDKKKCMFNIKEELTKTIDLIEKSYYKDNITIKSSSVNNFKMYGYPNELSHCFLILLQNAKDALDETQSDNKQITIYTEINKNNYTLIFENNGSLIDEKIINKIFNPYFSTKSEKNGTGIGLYMVKTIIEKHFHGSIKAYNTHNSVKFKITLKYV